MFRNFGIVLLIIGVNLVNAQSGTERGELLLKNGSLVKGVITFDDSYNTPDFITIFDGSESRKYQPSEVQSFEFENKKYISRYIELDQTEQFLNAITTKINEKSVQKDIFLRVAMEGNVSLFVYRDSRTHYFASKEDVLIELIRIPRYQNNGKLSYYNKYIGQLIILLSDCLKQEKINNVKYSISSIKRIIDDYNVCKDGESTFVEPKVPFKLNFYLVGGYKFSQYNITKEIERKKNFYPSQSDSNPTFGLAFDFNIFKNSESFKLFNELLYQSYSFETFLRDAENSEFYTDYTTRMDVAYIELTNSIRFNLQKAKHKVIPFVGVNLTNDFKVKDKSNEDVYLYFYGSERNNEQIPFNGNIKEYGISFSVSLGLTFNHLSLETRYGFNSQLSDYPTVSSSSNIHLLLNYKI